MPQCQGTTKSGDRCKRDVNEDAEYCGFHLDQAGGDEAADMGDDSAGTEKRSTDLLLIGVVAIALLALRRVIRF